MLKLKRLQILGFKSFCDRTELKFHGDGVAAIIGPNGCGKSNIADAISWVLGEQSAKTLRGSRMEDVIFAGTRDRKPNGMAEVSLTLIDPEVYYGPDASQPTEVDIQETLPAEASGDWDEAEVRARASEETERATEEAWPGKLDESEGDESKSESEIAAPLGPQVVLKIRRRKFQQSARAGEIMVTRRLFRSGESEYLLNGKLCRLRDIQELFMGTGLGPESYALIEQGRIGQILSSRPTDRRAILEEAAGITKFKTKKRLAEARLEDAKQNLSRVNDIFEEVTRQMNSLKRQAAKAERYAKLREEMRTALREVLTGRFAQLQAERTEIEAQMNTLLSTIKQQEELTEKFETEHRETNQRIRNSENDLRENQERISQLRLELDRGQARLRNNEERCLELTARMTASEAELEQSKARLASLEAERDQSIAIAQAAGSEAAAAQAELTQSQQAATEAARALTDMEAALENNRRALLENMGSGAAQRNRRTQAEERLAAVERESDRLQNEVAAASTQLEAFGGQRGQTALEFESVSQRVAALSAEISDTRNTLDRKRTEETGAKASLDSLRAEFATASGKRGSLEAMIAEHGYSTDSVRRLFQSGAMNGGMAPVGVLADFLEVENRYEGVVEDFLRDELNYIVVKSWDAADEGLRLLRSDVDGRATFLVHPEDSQAKFSFVVDENLHHAPPNHPVIPLKSAIRVLDGFGKSLEVILPKLRDGYIVPDPVVGRELALENPDAFFLSQSGECFHNVTVTGGKQRSEGPLSMKRELRDLMRLLNELESGLRHEETRVLTLGREIRDLTSRLDVLESEKREADKQAMTSGHMLRQLDTEMTRVAERKRICEQDLERLTSERDTQRGIIATCQEQIAALEVAQSAMELHAAESQMQLTALRERRDATSLAVSEKRAEAAALEERRRAAASGLDRVESQVAELALRVASLVSQIQRAQAEQSQRRAENRTIAEQMIEHQSSRESLEAHEALLQGQVDHCQERASELEESLREVRRILDSARDKRGELAASAARLKSDDDHLAETCLHELGVTKEDLLASNEIPPIVGDELLEKDHQYREMRSRLDAMGPVNMMALEEYKESAERHGFLDTQRKDLLDSIENTRATIQEIDGISQQKFNEAFQRINENFQITFRKLFGGGQAFMRLTDEANTAESGIDVVASPPGKKLQNVLLLSGGEKALTALSLLVGIFQYAPSPFCILDEVDAPLDEANIGRFTELVREMSLQTQFVLITHSKKTMSIAPVLYGVTMQEPGVSKLVSVRFGATA